MADIKRESVSEPSDVIPPSSFELKEIQYHGERGKPSDAKEDEGRRALYLAGLAAGRAEREAQEKEPGEGLGSPWLPTVERTLDIATLDDLRAAAASQGYALVRLTGEEASDDDLAAIEESAYTGEFGYAVEQRRALYTAGAASRQPEVDRLAARVAELEQRLALIAVLAHDRDGDSHEWRSRRLGDCSALTQFTKDRGVLGHVKLADSWAKRAEAAESELVATKEKLADAERERDVGYDALDVLMEREDRAKTELARERDDARAELTATKAKLAEVERERDDAAKSAEYLAKRYNATSDELERERRVVEAVNAILEKGPRFTDRHLEAAADAVVDEIREAMAQGATTVSECKRYQVCHLDAEPEGEFHPETEALAGADFGSIDGAIGFIGVFPGAGWAYVWDRADGRVVHTVAWERKVASD